MGLIFSEKGREQTLNKTHDVLLVVCARSKEIEAAGLNGADPFKEVRIQSVVVEFLLTNVEVLFSDSFTSVGRFAAGTFLLHRNRSQPCFFTFIPKDKIH